MLINKADRAVQSFVRRLEDFHANGHLQGGPSTFREISRDICAGQLLGTQEEFVVLARLHAKEARDLGLIGTHEEIKQAGRHIFAERRRNAVLEEAEVYNLRTRTRR